MFISHLLLLLLKFVGLKSYVEGIRYLALAFHIYNNILQVFPFKAYKWIHFYYPPAFLNLILYFIGALQFFTPRSLCLCLIRF